MTRRLIAVAVALAGGVSAAVACPLTHMDVVREDARVVLGSADAPRVAYIPEDTEHTIEAICHVISKSLANASDRPDLWAMGSEDGESAILLLRCVATDIGTRTLRDLELVFVSKPAHAEEARALVEQWGAKFYFVRDRGNEVDPAELFPEGTCPAA